MKFSILITSYNKKNYIEECILSCLKQDYLEKEIILLDNNSTDGSDIIFRKYEKDIKIVNKEKISNFPALNQLDLIKEGLSISTGDKICLLDGDDYFFKNKLSIIRKEFETNLNLKVVFDLPLIKKNNNYSKFKIKNKIQKNIWPTVINTSSISIEKQFLKDILKNTYIDDYSFLEIDFRINIYSRNIKKNYNITKKPYTVYRQLDDSIMGNMKKYSKKWWIKRKQAHEFMKIIYFNNGMNYNNKADLLLTDLVNKIIKLK